VLFAEVDKRRELNEDHVAQYTRVAYTRQAYKDRYRDFNGVRLTANWRTLD
jgi:hypothetical protein